MLADYEHLIGGFTGGLVSTLVCHPLDLLKIRYSVNDCRSIRPQYNSYWHAAKSIVRAQGFRALYQGLTPNIIANPLAWGLYFQIYNRTHAHFDVLGRVKVFQDLFVGCFAGAVSMAVTNPLWVAKTRLCVQYESEAQRRYRGLAHCLQRMWAEEGIRGWYRGFVPGLVGTLNGAIQYATYNRLKAWKVRIAGLPDDSKLATTDHMIFSAVSKVFATASIYPYQVVRTRLQDHHVAYGSARDVIVQTVRREGFLALYKGMWMTTLKQLPSAVVTYVVYEQVRHMVRTET